MSTIVDSQVFCRQKFIIINKGIEMEIFAKRLKELREEKELSQHQLAKELNYTITSSALSLWELGKRVPKLDALIVLADYFNVSIDYLAGRED